MASLCLTLVGCGEPIEQNELALVLATIGNRTVDTVNVDGTINNFQAELITAKRAPVQTPGTVVLVFPLGLQDYEFNQAVTPESPENEEIVCDSVGGRISFDVAVHMYIDPTFPDIKDRLIRLMQAYQLRQYAGKPDVLKELIHGRFRQILREPFVEYCAGKQVLDIIRGKTAINKAATDFMNAHFNPLGLRFPLVSIVSNIRLPEDQRGKMSKIVERTVENKILKLTNERLKPLENEIEVLAQDGETEAANILNTANAQKIETITAAQKFRRERFVQLVGVDNYVRMETMMGMVSGLESGGTKISVVPEGSHVFFGQGSILPTASPEADNQAAH